MARFCALDAFPPALRLVPAVALFIFYTVPSRKDRTRSLRCMSFCICACGTSSSPSTKSRRLLTASYRFIDSSEPVFYSSALDIDSGTASSSTQISFISYFSYSSYSRMTSFASRFSLSSLRPYSPRIAKSSSCITLSLSSLSSLPES